MKLDLNRAAAKIVAIYLIFGIAWILGSDGVLGMLVHDQQIYADIQSIKGLLYVSLTGLLLYGLIARHMHQAAKLMRLIKDSEASYRSLFIDNPNPMWVHDAQSLQVLEVNRAACLQYGYSREQFLKMPLSNLSAPGGELVLDNGLVQHRASDGRILDIDWAVQTISFEGRSARLARAIDISSALSAQRELADSQHLLAEAQRIARLGHWRIGLEQCVFSFSDQIWPMLGMAPEADGVRYDRFFWMVHPGDRPALQRAQSSALAGAAPLDVQLRIQCPDGRLIYLHVRGELVYEIGDRPSGLVGSAIDITELKMAESKVIEGERQYRKLVDLMPEGLVLHRGGRFQFCNQAALRLLGVTDMDELAGKNLLDWVSGEARENIRRRFDVIAKGATADPGFIPATFTNGTRQCQVEIASQPVTLAGESAVQSMIRDVTESERVKAALEVANTELHRLSNRVLEVQENERRQIARELHDEIGQALTAIKLHLEWHDRRQTSAPQGSPFSELVDMASRALGQVRDLSRMLRPVQLDQLGLVAALQDHITKLFRNSPILATFDGVEIEPRPDPAIETAAFRIVQEALTNTLKHASATAVTVRLRAEDSWLLLEVRDNGKGFVTNEPTGPSSSLGLIGMRERAVGVGGRLSIESSLIGGTLVQARLPLRH